MLDEAEVRRRLELSIPNRSELGKKMVKLVLAHGLMYEPSPLPEGITRLDPEHEYDDKCFWNSMCICRHYSLIYVEGIAIPGKNSDTTEHHGWTINTEKKVVDVTWSTPQRNTYFGIPFLTPAIVSLQDDLPLGSEETVLSYLAKHPQEKNRFLAEQANS